jgi:hypothetical protein
VVQSKELYDAFLLYNGCMWSYVVVSVLGGVLFGLMDGVINANPYAVKLFEVYKPIAKSSVNMPLGLFIDLVYGFVMVGLFLLLYKSLPGESDLVKGVSFGLIMWFFRVVMYVLTQLMMFEVPGEVLLYTLMTGLVEMLVIGMLLGVVLSA